MTRTLLVVLLALFVAACGGGTTTSTSSASVEAGDLDLSALSLDVHQAPD